MTPPTSEEIAAAYTEVGEVWLAEQTKAMAGLAKGDTTLQRYVRANANYRHENGPFEESRENTLCAAALCYGLVLGLRIGEARIQGQIDRNERDPS